MKSEELQEIKNKNAELMKKACIYTNLAYALVEVADSFIIDANSILNKLFPEDWESLDLYDRRQWLEESLSKKGTVQKDFVCIAEIWCECLGKDKTEMSRYNTREINEILRSLPEWESVSSTKNFSLYGKQKYYKRKDSLL